MKKILLALLVGVVLTTISCEREVVAPPATDIFLHFDFSVGEQESVSHYIIQTSADGVIWKDSGMIFATTNMEEKYQIDINANSLFGSQMYVYTRIKSVDIDTKESFSEVITVEKN